ncbi:hypothetical protein PGT21_032648 [Puccinia graminis f. sp. tritici]|uniref:Uncharacterized protein n=1 Tax=Puccinia graminis f. sp. tritici TaxID=56615 RepID=A0A5B0M6E3_PUCGR|nr:hypothetical protein PGT21_032648 [Puccinia graminis f. sp. tritici]
MFSSRKGANPTLLWFVTVPIAYTKLPSVSKNFSGFGGATCDTSKGKAVAGVLS